MRVEELVQRLHIREEKTRLEKERRREHLEREEDTAAIPERRHKIKTALCNTILLSCVRARMRLFSVCVSIKRKRLKPGDKCMKCYCG